MHKMHRDDISAPLVKERGETVYELVGAPAHIGGAKTHSAAEIVIRPGGSSARHYHLQSEETYYILRGSGRLIVDGNEHPMDVGDTCLICPGEWHQIYNDSTENELVLLAISAPPWVASDSVFDDPQASSI